MRKVRQGNKPTEGRVIAGPGAKTPKNTFRAEILGKNAVSRGDFEKKPFRAESRGDCINPAYYFSQIRGSLFLIVSKNEARCTYRIVLIQKKSVNVLVHPTARTYAVQVFEYVSVISVLFM